MVIRLDLIDWKFEGTERWAEGDYALFSLPHGAVSYVQVSLPTCKARPVIRERVYAWMRFGMEPLLRTGTYYGEAHYADSRLEDALGGMGFVQMQGQSAPGASGAGMLRIEDRAVCVWGILVGISASRPESVIVSWIPPMMKRR
ncbi:MAG: hypothetical protein C4348_02345 [Patescibacteria group bacterium]